MGSIKQLPEAVHSSMRSTVHLFDLARVVEELVYNSVDAGASKVLVFLNVGGCYVRVEDDGCGISRDGLVLLGEKYVTSKLQSLAEEKVDVESLTSRGETLGSLSHISLLEVITKTSGRPNGYRKVIKGCKSLYLGINDGRKEVGTTVIGRDLFYNQPVRRKCMQSSPKKVLQTVKKSIFRIALVFPQIFFNLVDVESEEELFCALPFANSLPLVNSSFGDEIGKSLNELHFTDGLLKLSGYLSSPGCSFSHKVFQYIYINSRFISKGAIHKLLTTLVAKLKGNPTKNHPEDHNSKRQKTQDSSAYLLNLCCPQSVYDLTFEPSRTKVEFKDWPTVQTFILKAVTNFWEGIQDQALIVHSRKSFNCMPDGKSLDEKREEHKYPASKDLSAEELPEIFKPSVLTFDTEHFTASISDRASKSFHDITKLNSGTGECFENGRRPLGLLDLSTVDLPDYFKPSVQTGDIEHFTAYISDRTSNSFHDIPKFNSDIGECFENGRGSLGLPLKYSSYGCQHQGFDYDCETNFDFSDTVSKKRDVAVAMMDSPIRMNQMATNTDFSYKSTIYSLKEMGDKNDSLNIDYDVDTRLRKSFESSEFNFLPETSNLLPFSHTSLDYGMVHDTDHWENFRINSNDSRDRSDWVERKRPLLFPDENCQREGLNYFIRSHQINGCTSQFSSPVLKRCRSSSKSDSKFRDFNAYVDGREDAFYVPPQEVVKPWHLTACNSEQPIYSDIWKGNGIFRRSSLSEGDVEHGTFIMSDFLVNQGESVKPGEDGHQAFSSIDGFLENLNKGGHCMSPEFLKFKEYNKEFPGAHSFSSKCKVKSENIYEPSYNKLLDPFVRVQHRKRSLSAPPFFKQRRKFSDLGSMLPVEGDRRNKYFQNCHNRLGSSNGCDASFRTDQFVGASNISSSIGNRKHVICLDREITKNERQFDKLACGQLTSSVEEPHKDEHEGMNVLLSKWRDNLQNTVMEASHGTGQKDGILDISSGPLQHSGGLLVPEAIDKNFLDMATVLPQLDKKFIPVISDHILAVVDQHAADERIRLEELHRKVLSGDGKTVASLDSEEELVIPEFGFQLLQNYAEQVASWGWICSTNSEIKTFTRSLGFLQKPSFKVSLVAVPCILGVKLSEKDLMDFLEQLLETDGSSIVPPAVHRILNYKSCRGAIMFGDSLLQCECSIIVEELKKTSLCFQCAHGRPTTVPLVNLKALRKQIEKLELQNGSTTKKWHGLEQHKSTLERARLRLAEDGG